jgi:hypothetical protein
LRISEAGELIVANAHRDPSVGRLGAIGFIYGKRLEESRMLLKLTPIGLTVVSKLLPSPL